MLGQMARTEVRRGNEIIPINLSVAADILLKKAKRVSPKAVHHNDPAKITGKLLEVFNCSANECGTITSAYDIADFIKNSINHEVNKFMKAINTATTYIDSLR